MKNKSLQNPFPTLVDKFFDKDKDGQLGFMETVFRDAHLKEMEQKRAAAVAEISAELQKKKEAMAAKVGHNMQRFVKAYPNLNRGHKLHNLKNLRNKKEK